MKNFRKFFSLKALFMLLAVATLFCTANFFSVQAQIPVCDDDDHFWNTGKVITEGSCTQIGYKKYTCKICKITATEPIARPGHQWDDGKVQKASTCKSTGIKVYTCKVCLATEKEIIPISDGSHNWNSGTLIIKATCETPGIRLYTCKGCGVQKTDKTPITEGHTLNGLSITVNATKTEAGYKATQCTKCQSYVRVSESNPLGVDVKPTSVEKALDAVVEVAPGNDIKVLQISDTQFIDPETPNSFTGGYLSDWYKQNKPVKNIDALCFDNLRYLIEKNDPDFIVLVGDNTYGVHDTDGVLLKRLFDFMDSYKIPWATVFGNHDFEDPTFNANAQVEYLTNSNYCVFHRGTVSGNGNYSIGLKQGGKIKRVLYMLDTHTHSALSDELAEENRVLKNFTGFKQDQVNWLGDTMALVTKLNGNRNIKTSLFYHVPSSEFDEAVKQYSAYNKATGKVTEFAIGSETTPKYVDLVLPPLNAGDSGRYEFVGGNTEGGLSNFKALGYGDLTFLQLLKKYGTDSVFSGHRHMLNTSILYQGIRWTYGVKSSMYDYDGHDSDRTSMGGTVITYASGVKVERNFFKP